MPKSKEGEEPQDGQEGNEPTEGSQSLDPEALASLDADTLKNVNPDLYQSIFREGHKSQRDASQQEITQLKSELETLRSYVQSAGGDEPPSDNDDPAPSGDDKSQALKRAERVLLEMKAKLEEKEKGQREFEKGLILSAKENEISSGLLAMGVQDDQIVNAILMPKARERLRVEDDNSVTVLDADKATPLSGGIKELIRQLFENESKDSWKKSPVSKGPSVGDNGNFPFGDGASNYTPPSKKLDPVALGKEAAKGKVNLSRELSFR